ncbi:similar to An07g04360 [Aspergillus luchuensis]|uniref:Similar to An07g04360 n=1 Tax=Aspergillus kawachii TaxID=1069201 RepID=A0A146FGX8_ASPKA|nr:similar to An07g04360 [Aspergillus luchuensis]
MAYPSTIGTCRLHSDVTTATVPQAFTGWAPQMKIVPMPKTTVQTETSTIMHMVTEWKAVRMVRLLQKMLR